MRFRHIVPALALLIMAGEATALDDVAPVTSLAPGDSLLTPVNNAGSVPDVDALLGADPNPALDLGNLDTRCFAFDSQTGWDSFATGIAPLVDRYSAGIAVVAASDNGLGRWQYDDGSGWVDLPPVSDDGALLLTLDWGDGSNFLRFVPNAEAGDGDATLTFRVWDGSDRGTPSSLASTINTDLFSGQPYGGSPTPFSAETRTLTVHVWAANDAPIADGQRVAASLIACIPKTVNDLLATTTPFSDPDFDTLGIAITETDTVAAGWEYNLGGSWLPLTAPAAQSGQALVLAPDALIRYLGGTTGGPGLLTVHGWDQTSGVFSGNLQDANDSSVSAASVPVLVLANVEPSIDTIDGLAVDGTLHARRGTTATFSVFGSDPDADDMLAWSASVVGYGGSGNVDVVAPTDTSTDITFDAGSNDSETIELELRDLAGNPVYRDITVIVTDNQAPTVDLTGQASLTVHVGGGDLSIGLTSSDGNDDTLTWSSATNGSGTIAFESDTTGAASGNSALYHPTTPGTDVVTITVDDGYGGVASTQVTITVLPEVNIPPSIVSIAAGSFAIVGQPFEAVVRATDDNAGDMAHLTITGSEPGTTRTKLANGLWRLRWTPTETTFEHGVTFTVTDPGEYSGSDGIYLDYVAAPATTVLTASTPPSTANHIVYGAIAPGSASAFTVLNGFLSSQAPSAARAFWWTGLGYAELPSSPASDPLRNGVFLASTTPAELTFAAPAQPAPFAISLRAGRWTFFGIPPLLVSSSGGTATSHPWEDIELQEEDGTTVDLETKIAAIGPSTGEPTDDDTQPFAYRWELTPAAYVRADTVESGTGYWIRNRSDTNYRLVRLATSGLEPSAVRFAHRSAASATRTIATADQPPAPPSSANAQAAEGGGSCGAGGLAGLLLAGLAMIGLRPRRRS